MNTLTETKAQDKREVQDPAAARPGMQQGSNFICPVPCFLLDRSIRILQLMGIWKKNCKLKSLSVATMAVRAAKSISHWVYLDFSAQGSETGCVRLIVSVMVISYDIVFFSHNKTTSAGL